MEDARAFLCKDGDPKSPRYVYGTPDGVHVTWEDHILVTLLTKFLNTSSYERKGMRLGILGSA
jgi:hypothetical protein